jgi:hypothetical protein
MISGYHPRHPPLPEYGRRGELIAQRSAKAGIDFVRLIYSKKAGTTRTVPLHGIDIGSLYACPSYYVDGLNQMAIRAAGLGKLFQYLQPTRATSQC